MNIFVGNLLFDATEADVKKLFEGFGDVLSVVIVMEREKKKPKSRGFGFVDMPDEQQALAAIAALNGSEFMGRELKVDPVRPKTEAQAKSVLRQKRPPKIKIKEVYPQEETEQAKTWFSPVFKKPGTYGGGRRARSYIKRLGSAGVQEEMRPRRKNHDNPLRWRKRKDQPKPWMKPEGEDKPWKKAEGKPKPWHKSDVGSKPWKKTQGEPKPWKKAAGEAKPWSKRGERPQESRFNGSRKPGGYKRFSKVAQRSK